MMPRAVCRLGIASVMLMVFPTVGTPELRHQSPEQNARVVACRVREAHTSRVPALGLLIFSQRDKEDAVRLSSLLRHAEDGSSVEIQSGEGGSWQLAQIFRLRSCFGRGLLLVPPGASEPAEGTTFLLRFPVATLRQE